LSFLVAMRLAIACISVLPNIGAIRKDIAFDVSLRLTRVGLRFACFVLTLHCEQLVSFLKLCMHVCHWLTMNEQLAITLLSYIGIKEY